jgi:hypothetical protein
VGLLSVGPIQRGPKATSEEIRWLRTSSAGSPRQGWRSPSSQASPAQTAHQSILVSSIKLDSSNIKNGSLLFKDFIKGEVVSGKEFKNFETSIKSYKQTTDASINTIKGEVGEIKNQLGGYIKSSDADARYIKLTDSVVRGDGSVFTATGQSLAGKPAVRLTAVPGMFTVDAAGPVITITNTSGAPLTHSACMNAQGQSTPAGTLQAGGTLSCAGDTAQTVQLIGAGGGSRVATLNFSSITPQGGASQNTVQILIGL